MNATKEIEFQDWVSKGDNMRTLEDHHALVDLVSARLLLALWSEKPLTLRIDVKDGKLTIDDNPDAKTTVTRRID